MKSMNVSVPRLYFMPLTLVQAFLFNTLLFSLCVGLKIVSK